MATPDGAFVRPDAHASSQTTLLPPWLSNSPATSAVRPPSPSVTLSLSPSVVQPSPAIPWLQPVRATDILFGSSSLPSHGIIPCGENPFIRELLECCKELEEKHRAWAAHKKEAAWRLKRVELQLESEKACKKREKIEEIQAKVKALREEQKAILDRIEAEYRDQLAELKRDADVKEQKLADQWAAKHARLFKFLEQTGFQPRIDEPNS